MAVKLGRQVTSLPSGLAVAANRVDDLSLKGTSGINEAVGASHETVCTQGGIRNILTSGEILKVSSTSADDTNTGSGHARRVRIRGILDDGTQGQEDVLLNGTGVVETTSSWRHINDFRVQKVGSGGAVNAGTINAYANDGTTILCQIAAGENQQQAACWAVGDQEAAYLNSFVVSATGDAIVSVWVNPNPANLPFFQKLTMFVGAGGPAPYQLPNPFPIPAGGIVEFRAKRAGGSDVKVGADMQILVETNP
jgi:hypothetical protein